MGSTTSSNNNAQRLLDPHEVILPRGKKRGDSKRSEGYSSATTSKTIEKQGKLPIKHDHYHHNDDTINSLPGTDLYTSPSGLYTIRLYQTHFTAEIVGPLGKSVVDPNHHHVINTFLEKYKVRFAASSSLVSLLASHITTALEPLSDIQLSFSVDITFLVSDFVSLFWS